MRTLLLAGACVIFISGSALACRGTTEYPEVFQKLDSSTMTELWEELSRGKAIHEEGHRLGDEAKMEDSLRILDAIKQKIGG